MKINREKVRREIRKIHKDIVEFCGGFSEPSLSDWLLKHFSEDIALVSYLNPLDCMTISGLLKARKKMEEFWIGLQEDETTPEDWANMPSCCGLGP